jgi:hypothetical protein
MKKSVTNTDRDGSQVKVVEPQTLEQIEKFDLENPNYFFNNYISRARTIQEMRPKDLLPELSELANDHTNEIVEKDTILTFEQKVKSAASLCAKYDGNDALSKRKVDLCMIAANVPYTFKKCQDLPSSELNRCIETDRRYRKYQELFSTSE